MMIIYGGAFNPPTKGHLKIIKLLKKSFHQAKILVMPVGDSYNKNELAEKKHRYNMLRLLTCKRKNVIVSRFELEKPFLGTYETLKHFKSFDDQVFYCLGSDHILKLDTWINYEALIKETTFIVIRRSGDKVDELFKKYEHLNPKYVVFDVDFHEASSQFRKNIEKNKKMTTRAVYRYIKKHKLYN